MHMGTKFVSSLMSRSAFFQQILNSFIIHAAISARHYIGATIIQIIPAFPVVPAFQSLPLSAMLAFFSVPG
jgi:hypothetical protein